MLRLILKRLLSIVPVLFIVTIIGFVLIYLTPGDPARIVAGDTATEADVEGAREALGLDRPLFEQYTTYLQDVLTLDFGTSLTTQGPVVDKIAETLPITASLALLALAMAVLLAIPAGIIAARKKQRWPDRLVTTGAAVTLAIPPFVVGLAVVVPLAIARSWLPATGYVEFRDDPGEWLRHLILPAFALALVPAAELARQIRGGLVDVMEQDFIRTGRAKGLAESVILMKHAMRNAAVPVVTVFGLQWGRILGGAVVVEKVFAIPGFGSMAFESVVSHDFVTIRAVILVSAVIVVGANLLVDVANGFLDPKLRGA